MSESAVLSVLAAVLLFASSATMRNGLLRDMHNSWKVRSSEICLPGCSKSISSKGVSRLSKLVRGLAYAVNNLD